MNEIELNIYLSSVLPKTIIYDNINEKLGTIKNNGLNFIVPITKDNTKIDNIIDINLIGEYSDYIRSIWDKDDNVLSWMRNYKKEIVLGEEKETFYPSLKISYKNPSKYWTPNPYWVSTYVEAFNPMIAFARYPFIISSKYIDEILLGKVPDSVEENSEFYSKKIIISRTVENYSEKIKNTIILYGCKEEILEKIDEIIGIYGISNIDTSNDFENAEYDIWNKKVQHDQQYFIEDQPNILPGEYLQLRWEMKKEYSSESSIIKQIPFETPLFTGGKLISKEGEGEDIKYVAEIFGRTVSNIVPTDFFDYEIGKWAYFIKDIELEGKYQKFSNSDVKSLLNTSEYMLSFVNEYRISNGLDPLYSNISLVESSQSHANDMATYKYFSHTSVDGRVLDDRIREAKYLEDFDEDNESYLCTENLHKRKYTKISKKDKYNNIYLDEENNPIYEIIEPSYSSVLQSWKDSQSHNANLLNPDLKEFGFGIAIDLVNEFYYYVQNFGYRTDGLGISEASKYRLTPFNFKSGMSDYMAISYENDLEIDFSNNFEKVFDMIRYDVEIISIDRERDEAVVKLSDETAEFYNIEPEQKLKIFYHCTGEPVIEGGSKAFKEGDLAILEKPKDDENFDNACIIGIKDKIRSCSPPIKIIHNNDYLDVKRYEIKVDTLSDEEYEEESREDYTPKDPFEIESEIEFPYEFRQYDSAYMHYILTVLTYDKFNIFLGVHGSNLDFHRKENTNYPTAYPRRIHAWNNISTFGSPYYSAICMYDGKILNFDFGENKRHMMSDEEKELLDIINAFRLDNNKDEFRHNIDLNIAAHYHTESMYDLQGNLIFFDVINPEEINPLDDEKKTTLFDRVILSGYMAQGLVVSDKIKEILYDRKNDITLQDSFNNIVKLPEREFNATIYINNGIGYVYNNVKRIVSYEYIEGYDDLGGITFNKKQINTNIVGNSMLEISYISVDYDSDLNQDRNILLSDIREIGLGIHKDAIYLVTGEREDINNTETSILDYGRFKILHSRLAHRCTACDVKEVINIQNKKEMRIILAGNKTFYYNDDPYNEKNEPSYSINIENKWRRIDHFYIYKLNKNDLMMELLDYGVFEVGDLNTVDSYELLGARILDNNYEIEYNCGTYNVNDGVFNYNNNTNCIWYSYNTIWNFINRELVPSLTKEEILSLLPDGIEDPDNIYYLAGIMDTENASGNYYLEYNDTPENNDNFIEGYAKKESLYKDNDFACDELFHLQSVLLHTINDEHEPYILYSEFDGNVNEFDFGQKFTYIIDSIGNKTNIKGYYTTSFFIQ